MYITDYLKQVCEAVAKLKTEITEMDSAEYRNSLRDKYGEHFYPYLFGKLSASAGTAASWAQSALKQLESEKSLLDFEVFNLKTTKKGVRWPTYWHSIPKTVVLTCPECGAGNECEVGLDDECDTRTSLTVGVAEIDTDACEDCGKHLCPLCPRTKENDMDYCRRCRPVAELAHS